MIPTLIILIGPTGVGKTELSLHIAETWHAPIISADSRQLYRELPIGTAAPTLDQQQRVPHYLVGNLELTDYYSASQFETDVLELLDKQLFPVTPVVLMTGGSMMYIDAVWKGIDDIPTIRPDIREQVYQEYEEIGLQSMLDELKRADPIHYDEVDRNNYKRVLHAIEVCRQTGKPYSSFRTYTKKERPFQMICIGLTRDREELCERINLRVDEMMKKGLLEEAKRVYPYRHLNSLNTVGYKELFQYLEGNWSLDFAVEKIKRNSRVYARKQMTWFKRDKDIQWFHPDQVNEMIAYISSQLIK